MTTTEIPYLDTWVLASTAADELEISRQSFNKMIRDGRVRRNAVRRLKGPRPIYVIKAAEVSRLVKLRSV